MRPYRRSQILIDKRFQLRFALYVVSWTFALSLIYPLLLQRVFDVFINYLALDPMGPPVQVLQGKRTEMTYLLWAIQALFIVITFLISLFLSHRIAGPLYKLKKSMREAMAGGFPRIHFRSQDHFQDLSDAYNQLADGMRQRSESLVEARSLIEKALPEANAPVRATLEKALQLLK